MGELQYGHDDARDYEPYFSRHLMAMTAENLHSKGEIACELAYRDARIAELEAVAEAAVIVCQLVDEKSSMVYGLLERPLRAAGYLGGGE